MNETKMTSLADAIRQKMEQSKNKDLPETASQKKEKTVPKTSPKPFVQNDTGLINSIKKTKTREQDCVRLTLRLPSDLHLPLQFITEADLSLNKMAVYALSKLLEEKEIQNKINEKLKLLTK